MIPQFVKDRLEKLEPRWYPTAYKGVLIGMVASAIVIPLGLVAVPFLEFFNGMAAQPKAKAQMTYGRVFGDTLLVARDPVPGTVPQDYEPYRFNHLGNTLEDAKKAGEALENPLPVTRENLEKGQQVYNIFCIACHGAKGEGDGGVTGPNRFPAPPSLHTDQARAYKDGTIFHFITKGQGKMPSYANQIEPEERWQAVLYVRALQRAMNPNPEDLD